MDRPDVNQNAASGPEGNAGTGKPSLDDAISAALSASTEPPASKEVPVKSIKAEKIKVKETAPDPESAGDERDGEDAPSDEPSKPAAAKDEKAPIEAPKLSEPPKHWAQSDKEAFASLPDDAKNIVLKLSKNLEGGFTRKSQELSDKARYADNVRSLFNDGDRMQMQAAGTNEEGVIRYLLGVQRFASQKPVEYLKWAMNNLKVTPEHLGFSQAQPTAAQQKAAPKSSDNVSDEELASLLADPRVDQLEARLKTFEQREAEFERQRQLEAHQRQASAVKMIEDTVSNFRSEIDDTGQLKYPHFDLVMAPMGALMAHDPNLVNMPDGPEKLDLAYQMAVYANPELRQSLIAAETAKAAEAERKKLEADRARRATAVKPAAGAATTPSRKVTLDDAITFGMGKLASR